MKQATFYIDGMSCAACSSGIEKSLSRKSYCKAIFVNLITKQAIITYDENQIELDSIFAFIKKLGYTPYMQEDKDSTKNAESSNKFFALLDKFNKLDSTLLPQKLRIILSVISSIVILVLAWSDVGHRFFSHLELFILQICITLFVMHLGRAFYFRGFKALFARNPNMDSLIALGSLAAFVYSFSYAFSDFSHMPHLYFDSACVIITLIMLGKFIESSLLKQAKQSAEILLELNQKPLHRLQDSNTSNLLNATHSDIPASQAKINDYIRFNAGEMVLVDGQIVACGLDSGVMIELSCISGESAPVKKNIGDFIPSGANVLDSSIIIKATSDVKNSNLGYIISLVNATLNSKPKIALLADKIASIFVPIVIALALLTGATWWILADGKEAFSYLISTLVIACPCALGLATPMAILNTQSVLNKMGAFFKSVDSLQNLSNINHIIFDKTGTLTSGLEIKQIVRFSDIEESELFSIALSLESSSTHIIANAFKNYHLAADSKLREISNIEHIAGLGIRAKIDSKTYTLGSKDLLDSALLAKINTKQEYKISVFLLENERLLGAFYLSERIKQDAKAAIQAFKDKGITLSIISGDNKESVKSIADELNITHFIANAKPQDKLNALQELNQLGKKILMVGDGVNDTLALAQAHCSAAFVGNSDIVSSASNVLIYNNKLSSLYNAYRLSCASIKNIKQNLGWAFIYNIIFIPIAMGIFSWANIHLEPSFCALTMSLSSLSVMLNAARLRAFKLKE